MKKLLAVSTIGLSALAFTPNQAQAFVLIDNFNTGDIIHNIIPPGSASGSVAAAPGDIINNSNRDYQYNVTGTGRSPASLSVDGPPSLGGSPTASINNITTSNSTTKFTYNDNGPYDLISTDEDQIGFSHILNNGPADVKFIINGVSSPTYTTTLGPGRFAAPFTDFPGVDFNNVTSIELLLSGPIGHGLKIDNFQTSTIPEPMTILGTAFALTTLPGLKKAYSKKKAKA